MFNESQKRIPAERLRGIVEMLSQSIGHPGRADAGRVLSRISCDLRAGQHFVMRRFMPAQQPHRSGRPPTALPPTQEAPFCRGDRRLLSVPVIDTQVPVRHQGLKRLQPAASTPAWS